ncbi:MAG: tetratricopeptide repeat protein [Parachlamydia sp.]|nr:tetratricopeptide repeat protein [Parachlamydia sp.]
MANLIAHISQQLQVQPLYTNEQGRVLSFVRLAAQVDTCAHTAFFHLAQMPDHKWIGQNGLKQVVGASPKLSPKTVRDSNLDAVRIKISWDLYSVLGGGVYQVPTIQLSYQPVAEEEILWVMSKELEGFQDFKQAKTWDQNECSFLQYLQKNQRPPDQLLTPDKKMVPLQGIMELLAVGRALADTAFLSFSNDALTSSGFIWIRNLEGEIIAAQAVLSDSSKALNFQDTRYRLHCMVEPRDLDESRDGPIRWSKLSIKQKQLFLTQLKKCMSCVDDQVSSALGQYTSKFHTENPQRLIAGLSELVENIALDLQNYLKLLQKIYNKDFATLEDMSVVTTQPTDPESTLYRAIMGARKHGQIDQQVDGLQKIAQLYTQKKNFLLGAKLVNAALALLPTDHPLEESLLEQLEEIEEQFFAFKKINKFLTKDSLKYQRKYLKTIRSNCSFLFSKKVSTDVILKELTHQFQALTANLIQSGIDCLGPPPTKWACLGMGSMAREEACPFSDLECAFIIEKATPETRDYFRLLTHILELRIINLGETRCVIFGEKEKSPTPHGFCLDEGGNTPCGDRGTYELIGTARELAQFQQKKWVESAHVIMANAMSTVCLIAGDRQLYDQYHQEKEAIHNQKQAGMLHRESFALHLLEGHLTEFFPDLSIRRERQDRGFGIKKNLYRPFQEMIHVLAIFYGLKAKNTLERVQELVTCKILSIEGGKNLRNALLRVLGLRIEAHLFYKESIEILCYQESKQEDPHLLYLKKNHIDDLLVIHKALLPFCRCMQEFFRSKDIKFLQRQKFYEMSPEVRGNALEKGHQFYLAKEVYQQAVVLDPQNTYFLFLLFRMEYECTNYDEALKRAQQIVSITRATFFENHPDMAFAYRCLGMALNSLDRPKDALEYHQAGLAIRQALYDDDAIFISLHDIADTLCQLHQVAEGLSYQQKALQIALRLYGENNANTAICYRKIGASHMELNALDEALENFQKALAIQKKISKEKNSGIAATLLSIGFVFQRLRNYEDAIEFFYKALENQLQLHGEKHCFAASCYRAIGLCFRDAGHTTFALDALKKSASILEELSGSQGPELEQIYFVIASLLQKLGHLQEYAIYQQKALAIQLRIYHFTQKPIKAIEEGVFSL